jgi:hypothetical protein
MRTIVLLVLVACAHAAPTVATAPAPCPVDPAAAPVPAEDAALRKWKAVMADEFRPPAGAQPAALVPELVGYLSSPDPVRRDEVAYSVLERWISKQVLSDVEVRALADQLVANLGAPIGGPDSVFGRSFAALMLATIVERDAAKPCLTDAQRRAILTTAHDYAHRETDLRGHTGARGWAHGAAHTADLLVQLAKLPAFTDDDRATMLDAITGFIVRRHEQVLKDGEDGRLAVAILAIANAGIDPAKLTAWLTVVKAPIFERWGPAFDAGRYAAARNARNLLFSAFVQISLKPQPSDAERRLLDALRAAMAG